MDDTDKLIKDLIKERKEILYKSFVREYFTNYNIILNSHQKELLDSVLRNNKINILLIKRRQAGTTILNKALLYAAEKMNCE
tara:strand:- start:33429 stop:33674 length:246 start_codon:yes stop_codon:yes gene_type:complete